MKTNFTPEQIAQAAKVLGFENGDLMLEHFKQEVLSAGLCKSLRNPKLLPSEWEKITGIEIIDPDGWSRMDFDTDWHTKITLAEFKDKSDNSTIRLHDCL